MNRSIFLICMQQTNQTLHSNGSPPPSPKIKQMRYPHRSHSFHLPTQTITNSPSLPLNSHPNSQSQTLILDLAKTLATQLDSCTDPKLRAQIHTRFLRFNLLHSPFHWNSLMRCYLRHGHPGPTLALFTQMRRRGAHPDPYTLPLALKAACHVYSSPLGRQLHCLALKHGLARHRFTESGIISLYSKSGLFGCAHKVFDENPERGIGSWNAMVNGLAQAGRAVEAIGLFVEMRASGLVPDEVTMVSVVSACGGLGDVGLAEQVHKLALQVRSSF